MDERYLGDSYDLVKRSFRQILDPVAPLYSHPLFVPSAIRDSYVAATTVPILGAHSQTSFGILLDPDKGVCLGRATRKHVSLPLIAELHQTMNPKYIICFDQSFNRNLDLKQQMQAKVDFLQKHGLHALYYVSHAAFLFTTQSSDTLDLILQHSLAAGLPKCRFKIFQSAI